MHNVPKTNIASSAQDDTETSDQSEPVWLNERQLEQKGPQEKTGQPANDEPAETTAEQAETNTGDDSDDPEADESSAKLTISKAEIIVAPGAVSDYISALVSEADGEITWSIAAEKDIPAGYITIEKDGEQLEPSTSFRIRTGSSIKPGTYQITVTAKNTDFNLTKTLTAIVR